MTKPRDISFTLEQQWAYFYLGIIAVNSGYKQHIYSRKCKLGVGVESEEGGIDLLALLAENTSDEELQSLHKFRNRLLHGVCTVKEDGSLQIFDKGEEVCFSLQELENWAKRFMGIRLEHRISINVHIESICKSCGFRAEQDEFHGHVCPETTD